MCHVACGMRDPGSCRSVEKQVLIWPWSTTPFPRGVRSLALPQGATPNQKEPHVQTQSLGEGIRPKGLQEALGGCCMVCVWRLVRAMER